MSVHRGVCNKRTTVQPTLIDASASNWRPGRIRTCGLQLGMLTKAVDVALKSHAKKRQQALRNCR